MDTQCQFLAPEEMQRIFETADLALPEGVAVALFAMGYRASEIARLRRGDVAEDAGGTLVKVGGTCLHPPRPLASALRSFADKGDAEGSLLGLTAAHVRRALQAVAERAGVKGVTVRKFHDSLVAFGSRLHTAWKERTQLLVSLDDVRLLLGHAQAKSTERYLAPRRYQDR